MKLGDQLCGVATGGRFARLDLPRHLQDSDQGLFQGSRIIRRWDILEGEFRSRFLICFSICPLTQEFIQFMISAVAVSANARGFRQGFPSSYPLTVLSIVYSSIFIVPLPLA